MDGQAGPSRSAKPQQALGEPFDSAYAVEQSLQTRDANALQAALTQIDKRAIALVEKDSPRAQPDLLLDYIRQNPGCDGVFAAWELANKTNNSPLSAAALSCLTSLVRLASTDPFTSSPEIVKSLFSAQYAPYFERSLNPGRNDVTTAVLKLCNVLVGFAGGKYARKVFGCFGWSPKVTSRLYKTRLRSLTSFNALAKPDIRTLLVLLVVSFLSAGDVRLKTQVLETKGLLSGVFKGLNEDAEVVVNLVLETVGRELVVERRVALDARRNLFDEACINELVKLYDCPLPVGDVEMPASHPSLSVHRFFRLIAFWLADQIATSPVGRSSGPQRVLATLLRALKVTEDSVQRELGLEILRSAPVLAGAFWLKFPSSLDPRLSSRWVSAITFATQVVGLPVPATLSIPADAANALLYAPPSVSSILDTILPPPTSSTLNRTWYTKALTHEVPLVSFLSSLFVLSILQKASTTLETMAETSRVLEETASGPWAIQVRKVREELKLRLPDPAIVVGLMTKTAAAASGEATAGSAGSKKKAKAVEKKEEGKDTAVEVAASSAVPAGSEGALLRTNVALRILFLYHRVCPQLIATLKFDFAKLPQTYARRPTSAPTAEATTGDQGEEGIRAISSAYALRLAAAHSTSSSIMSFNRPGDHFKQSLVPLFQLYRTPSTPSNRSLLREILKRQLDTPLLFGTSSAEEIEVWLRALPVPMIDSDEVEAVLSFFESTVQKTLTSPLKASEVNGTEVQPILSPLMQNVIAALPTALKSDDEEKVERILAFYRDVVLHLVAQQQTLDAARQAVEALQGVAKASRAAGPTSSLLNDCIRVLTDANAAVEAREGLSSTLATLVADGDADALSAFVSTLSPLHENVFAAVAPSNETSAQLVQAIIGTMPIPLVLLHARETDMQSAPIRAALLDIVEAEGTSLLAIQILLHRLSAGYSSALASFAGAFATAAKEHDVRAEIAERVAGKQGLLPGFAAEDASMATYEGMLALLSTVLNSTVNQHRQLAQPFCELVLADLHSAGIEQAPKKKRKHRESGTGAQPTLSPRVLAAGPLLPFFDAAKSLPLLDALITHLAASELDDNAQKILNSALEGVLALPPTDAFIAFWSSQLLRLHALARDKNVGAAAQILTKGARAIMPLQDISRDESAPWRSQAASWTQALLASGEVGATEATTLAALVYRSSDARSYFASWLNGHADDVDLDVLALAPVLTGLLDVTAARGDLTSLPSGLVVLLIKRALESKSFSEEAAQCLTASLRSSPDAESAIAATLEKAAVACASIPDFRHLLPVTASCARASAVVQPILAQIVNSSFGLLTRALVEEGEDHEDTLTLVTKLTETIRERPELRLDGASLDVLLTAIATSRGDRPYAAHLAILLCERHALKDNEVTRHLNELYASAAFLGLAGNPASADASVVSATLDFALALAARSPASAASARSVERLLPFYRGTLSSRDRALLDVFQRVELMSPASIAPALSAWVPTSEPDISLDGSRIGAIGAADKKSIRRSWAVAFASSVSPMPAVEAQRTYDPIFLVNYVAALVEEDDMKPQDWTTLLESGILGTCVAALAASPIALRGMARTALASLTQRIKPLTFREKDELELVLTQIRLSIYSQAGEPLPASIALFLAHCVALIGAPESPLYPTFTRFLLQRSTVDARDVPMFYSMLYSSNADEFAASPRDERLWMVRFLTEGLVRSQDWKIYRRRQVFELVASLFSSTRQDPRMRKAVLKLLEKATRIPTAARELLSRNGLLGWLAAQTWQDNAERQLALDVVSNVLAVLPWDKLPGVADAVEAVEVAVGKEAAQLDAGTQLAIIRTITTHLAPPSSAVDTASLPPLLPSILSRLSLLLEPIAVAVGPVFGEQFYATAMLLAFVRSEAGIAETLRDRRIWRAALRAGLDAEVQELQREVTRMRSD